METGHTSEELAKQSAETLANLDKKFENQDNAQDTLAKLAEKFGGVNAPEEKKTGTE